MNLLTLLIIYVTTKYIRKLPNSCVISVRSYKSILCKKKRRIRADQHVLCTSLSLVTWGIKSFVGSLCTVQPPMLTSAKNKAALQVLYYRETKCFSRSSAMPTTIFIVQFPTLPADERNFFYIMY